MTPQRLFLIDGAGAFVTASLLAFVLAPFEQVFGMPRKVLYPLALVACVLGGYSMSRVLLGSRSFARDLLVIAVANVGYCALSLGAVAVLRNELRILGAAYFLGEVAVIAGLVVVELRTRARLLADQQRLESGRS